MMDTSPPLSSEDNARREAQRALLQASMLKTVAEQRIQSMQGGEWLLRHLDMFLIEKEVNCNKLVRSRGHAPLEDPGDPGLTTLQHLITEWATSLPLDVSVEYKTVQWSIPAVLLRELFWKLAQSSHFAPPVQYVQTRSEALWMTLLLNGLWSAATPELKKKWISPLSEEGSVNTTHAWLFWAARFQACIARQEGIFPILVLPSDLTHAVIEQASLQLHASDDTKTRQKIEAFKYDLWDWDVRRHASLWRTPSLFNAARFDTLWRPHLVSDDLVLPSALRGAMASALCDFLTTQPETFSVENVQAACLFLFDTFPVLLENAVGESDFSEREVLSQRLLASLEHWSTHHPETHTEAWCTLSFGKPGNAARWRMFWEQCFLKHVLIAHDEQEDVTISSLKARRRV